MRLSKVNNLLLLCIVLVNSYVILAPLIPTVIFAWQDHQGKQQSLTRLLRSNASATSNTAPTTEQPNSVVIPSMLLNKPILEGAVSHTYQILDQGIWRWPEGSTPDKGGNTILIGHRFTYTNPRGVFYYLNKVTIGDEIGIFWNNKEYLYRVVSVSQVVPSDTTIEDNTPNPELTIFTCTPLWLPRDRLVVVADLEGSPS
jgi:LPXTG-site transpeptidase (sortase) family protein